MSSPADVPNPGAAIEAPKAAARGDGQAIVHPWVDFLCLGGGSLVLIPVAMQMPEAAVPAMIALMWMLADVLNHPHFAASYQIFYRGYRQKAFGDRLGTGMRVRYLVAGIVVPAALILFFAASFALQSAVMLGWAGNLMLFLVGWHYTKQGYGMLMVDSVYRRRFFNDREKLILRYNTYACWILFWLGMNWYFSEREMWGLSYFSFDVPQPALWAASAVAALTTTLTLKVFLTRLAPGKGGLPVSGTVAYLVSLYFWALARFNPLAIIFVPAFHSLQYLVIVWRFETNRAAISAEEGGSAPAAGAARWPVMRFAIVAFVLGLSGFYWLPRLFDQVVSYDTDVFGPAAFMFMFWIFINIHHYFVDNVIWRRENPDTARFLFGAKKK